MVEKDLGNRISEAFTINDMREIRNEENILVGKPEETTQKTKA
jgi:hypothetical protein